MINCGSRGCKKHMPLVQCKYCPNMFCFSHLPEKKQNVQSGHDCPKTIKEINQVCDSLEKVEAKKIDRI
jgi:hypothetical protein